MISAVTSAFSLRVSQSGTRQTTSGLVQRIFFYYSDFDVLHLSGCVRLFCLFPGCLSGLFVRGA